MEIQQKQKIVAETLTFMQERNMLPADMARLADVSSSHLTAMFKQDSDFTIKAGDGKVAVISNKTFMKLVDAMGNFKRKDEDVWQPVITDQLKVITSTLEEAEEFGYTRVIIGETGCGKSYVCERFVNRNPKSRYLITVGSTDTIGDLLDKVLDVLKLSHGKSKSKKINSIVKSLKERKLKGEKVTLIFDESEYMKQATLCNMKELHDQLNSYISLVMIGTDQLTEKLEKLKSKNRDGIPQFYRRIRFGIRHLNRIDTLFKPFLNDIKDVEFKKFLQDNCDNYGELHDAMVPVIRESQRTGEPITERFARKVLHLPNI